MFTRTVRLKLRFAGFETHTFQSTLEVPTDLDDDFLQAAEELVAQALPKPRPVRLVGIGAAALTEAVQESLLDPQRDRRRGWTAGSTRCDAGLARAPSAGDRGGATASWIGGAKTSMP